MTRDDAVANYAAVANHAAAAHEGAQADTVAQVNRAAKTKGDKTILILTPQFPHPPHQGTTIRNYNLIKGLAQTHRVHLLSFGEPEASRGTPLDELCCSVQVIRPPQRSTLQRLKDVFLSRLPDMAQRLPSARFAAALAAVLARERPNVVQVEGIELAPYLFQVAAHRGEGASPLAVFDDHNAEYVLQKRAFETDMRQIWPPRRAAVRRLAGAAYSWVQWQRLRRYERRACQAADRVMAVSEVDASVLRALSPGLEPVVVPNGVDMEFYTGPQPTLPEGEGPGAADLVFVGKMDFRPNVDAVLWFAAEVLPLIRREAPGTCFWVVGQSPHARLGPLAHDPGVKLTGWVEDQRPYIAGAGVYVIPLRIGGGTRLKVLEAMAMSKAIVSTTLGCEGFDLVPGQDLIVADSPAAFSTAVLELLHDAGRRNRLGRAAQRLALSRYDWSMILPRVERAYQT
jgi:glycosyltransferase involved in cell wall biosynthesis